MTHEEELLHCVNQRQAALDRLALIKRGVRYMRGVPGQPTTDVTAKSKEHDEANVAYWTRRLELLGYGSDD